MPLVKEEMENGNVRHKVDSNGLFSFRSLFDLAFRFVKHDGRYEMTVPQLPNSYLLGIYPPPFKIRPLILTSYFNYVHKH